jgi:hypothetical protein
MKISKKPTVVYLKEIGFREHSSNQENIIKKNTNVKRNSNVKRNNNDNLGPISGSEPKYNPKKWNDNIKIKGNHNCFSYMLDASSVFSTGKAQPGYSAGYPSLKHSDYDCNTFLKRLKKDAPSLYTTTLNVPCKKGFHKAFIAMDDHTDHTDYHFYRQDRNGFWSHKPGLTDVTNLDASGKKIKNPLTADRNYTNYKYTTPCFFFCVNKKLAKSRSVIQK